MLALVLLMLAVPLDFFLLPTKKPPAAKAAVRGPAGLDA